MSGERRTKAQKMNAKISHTAMSYSFANNNVATKNTAEESTYPMMVSSSHTQHQALKATSMNDLFSYDISLIYRDLAKTIGLTVIIFAALIGLTVIR